MCMRLEKGRRESGPGGGPYLGILELFDAVSTAFASKAGFFDPTKGGYWVGYYACVDSGHAHCCFHVLVDMSTYGGGIRPLQVFGFER